MTLNGRFFRHAPLFKLPDADHCGGVLQGGLGISKMKIFRRMNVYGKFTIS